MFFHVIVDMLRRDKSNAYAHNHMSTIMIVVFSYLCCDSNTDDNDSLTIATIAKP